MIRISVIMGIVFGGSILLFILEYFLAKKQKKAAIILPVVVLCTAVVFGLFSIIISLCMFAIFLMVNYLQKKDAEKIKDINKMNIQDL